MPDLEIQTKVAVLERDVNQFADVIQKLDQNIEKLTDVSQTVKQLLAIHETRLDSQERKTDDVIAEVHMELQKINERIKDLDKSTELKFAAVHERLDNLDKMKWIIIGIVAALSLISKVDLSKLVALF